MLGQRRKNPEPWRGSPFPFDVSLWEEEYSVARELMKWSHKPLPGVNSVLGYLQLCRGYKASLGYVKHSRSTETDRRAHLALLGGRMEGGLGSPLFRWTLILPFLPRLHPGMPLTWWFVWLLDVTCSTVYTPHGQR